MVLLLGTKDDIDTEPIERPKFIEDMNESELASAVCIQMHFSVSESKLKFFVTFLVEIASWSHKFG